MATRKEFEEFYGIDKKPKEIILQEWLWLIVNDWLSYCEKKTGKDFSEAKIK